MIELRLIVNGKTREMFFKDDIDTIATAMGVSVALYSLEGQKAISIADMELYEKYLMVVDHLNYLLEKISDACEAAKTPID